MSDLNFELAYLLHDGRGRGLLALGGTVWGRRRSAGHRVSRRCPDLISKSGLFRWLRDFRTLRKRVPACLLPLGSWLLLLVVPGIRSSGRFSSFPLPSSGGRQQHKKWCLWWSTVGGFPPPLFQLLQSDGASLCDAFLEERKGSGREGRGGLSFSLSLLCSLRREAGRLGPLAFFLRRSRPIWYIHLCIFNNVRYLIGMVEVLRFYKSFCMTQHEQHLDIINNAPFK